MEITIVATAEDKEAVLKAIRELDAIPHMRHMSMAKLAEYAGIKETKVRATLIALIEEKKITQYRATENPRLQRFYYLINKS